MYGDSVCRLVHRRYGADVATQASFYLYYYGRAVRNHPLEYLAKVYRVLRQFYRVGDRILEPPTVTARSLSGDPTKFFPPAASRYPIIRSYVDGLKAQCGSPVAIEPHWLTRKILRALAKLYLPCVAVSLFLGVFVLWRAARSRQPCPLTCPAALALVLPTYNLGHNLTAALTHALETDRYIQVQTPVTVLSGLYAIFFLVLLCKSRSTVPAPCPSAPAHPETASHLEPFSR